MKKTLTELFDEAQPEEMEPLLKDIPSDPLAEADVRKIQKKVRGKITPRKRRVWVPMAVSAACLCLILGVAYGMADPVRPNDIDETGGILQDPDVIYTPQELSQRPWYDQILWHGGELDEGANVEDREETENVQWNGVTLSPQLYRAIFGEGVLPIRVQCEYMTDQTLDDFVYNGKSYSQMRQEFDELHQKAEILLILEDLVRDHEEKVAAGDEWEFWEKYYANLGDDIGQELKSAYYDGVGFHVEQIGADCEAALADSDAIAEQMALCRQAYNAQCHYIDLTLLAHDYCVVQNNGCVAVFVESDRMEDFAAKVVEVYGEKSEDCVFTLASRSYLGLAYGEPVDEEEQPADEQVSTTATVGDELISE